METRVAVIGIIVENTESAEKINSILHEYSQYILGRMGVPYQKRGISVISIIMDAPQPVISALSGKLGKLEGVSTKALYSNVMENIDG
ncbi:iron-only hydrogenase system regulator [[Clostridium] innocuum]|uniref:Iron-only hydrogenase system regulator n=1 Tax=Clostridium innocuum TaxID=1522 RepID=A0A099IBT3_CLOIN|nr:TM1266 family iron-only hydrogenase system putative regulator [[Clostridium] innocuum]KGJ54368.1 iron-only hydrogenase system regulator [[Clostridium] innocuum]MCR0270559.1 iron-only hydrogenase system regulator [[Clostridium] innocuum]